MSTIVPGIGPRDAKILFVGEAPGKEEELQGLPFVGASGHLLNQTLDRVGINRHECYFTNVVKIRPPGNDFGVFYNDPKRREPSALLTASISQLHEEIRAIRPNIVVPLGAEPFRAICGYRSGGIEAWRGSLLQTNLGKVCATYHPAFILRVYETLPIFQLDLARVKSEGSSPFLVPPKVDLRIDPSYEEVMDYLRSKHDKLSFDIETTYGSFVRCIAFSSDGVKAISIPFMSHAKRDPNDTRVSLIEGPTLHSSNLNSHWEPEQEYRILEAMDDLFLGETKLIAQNMPFDTTVLQQEFGFAFKRPYLDTMLAHWVNYVELPKALDFLGSIYTKIPYYSNYDCSVDRETWVYNAYDALVTWQVAEKVEKELEENGLTEYYHNHVHPAMLAYTRAQNRGVKINEPERQRQRVILNTEIDALEVEIRAQIGDPKFNPNSPKQLSNYLYSTLKLDPVYNHKTKRITTDKHAMEALARKYPQHERFFNAIAEHGSKTNVRSGFFNLSLPKGRIYTSFNNAGTVTSRLSSSDTFLHPDDSTNLQNIQRPPALTRACFIADEGMSLIKADLSQAEFRLVVWFAKINRLIKVYLENPNFDVHKWVASLIYKKPESEIAKAERDVAKNGVYGGNYKMHYLTAARTYKLSYDLAKWVLDEYRKAVPEIPVWWDTVQHGLFSRRTLTNPLGMRRMFFGRCNDDMLRAALSHLPQSTVGGVINRAAQLADEIFHPSECPLLLQVHDELVWQCRDDLVSHYVPMIKNLMEYPLHFDGVEEPLVIPAEVSVGKNWMPRDYKDKLQVKQLNVGGQVDYHEWLKGQVA